jgi:hypothetical protein
MMCSGDGEIDFDEFTGKDYYGPCCVLEWCHGRIDSLLVLLLCFPPWCCLCLLCCLPPAIVFQKKDMFEKTQKLLNIDERRKLISFDAFDEIAPGGGPNGLPLGIASEEKKLRLAKREYERNERRRKRAEAEALRMKTLMGDQYIPSPHAVTLKKIPWTLDRSVWAPRKLETDSNDYFDTDNVLRQACLADFRHAHRIIKLIKNSAEYVQVQDFIASHYRKLLGCYRMWCASDAQFGPFQMTNFAFKEFATTSTG